MNGAPGSPAQHQTGIGSSRAVPQGARSRPQPREAVGHHTTSAHVWKRGTVWASRRLPLGQLLVKQRLVPRLSPDPSFGPVIGLLTPIAFVRAPANLRWYCIALDNQLACLLTTERF